MSESREEVRRDWELSQVDVEWETHLDRSEVMKMPQSAFEGRMARVREVAQDELHFAFRNRELDEDDSDE